MGTEAGEYQQQFIRLLKAEGRHAVLDVGCGAGDEGLKFVQAGIHYTGVDPSVEQVHHARARGLDATVAAAPALPFADGAFPAVWAVHTPLNAPALESSALDSSAAGSSALDPPAEEDDVVRELMRVVTPGAPVAVGGFSRLGGRRTPFQILRAPL
jgi:SAM-dependent methyltransferase